MAHKVDLSKIWEHIGVGNQQFNKTAKEAGMEDIDERFENLVEAMESLVEEIAAANTELVERLRERMDAMAPALDDIGTLLNEWCAASFGHKGDGEGDDSEIEEDFEDDGERVNG